ncbi:TetR family transcriptional regulator [Nocardia asteroides]|uniref:TetR family transcriptional regulator n=1 Tax=Nocardia asteroides TaxID=1824 RepID=UPI00366091F2
MGTFQRARSEEQREERRQVILRTAATMLGEMPLSAVSLNELSRRVGLAKSNVLRYFESREAVLLDLLVQLVGDFIADTAERLSAAVEMAGSVRARAASVAAVLAATFAAHPMLCELISAQAGVLERNVSTEAVLSYKRSAYASLSEFTADLRRVLPELGDREAAEAAMTILLLAGALWTHAHPPQAVLEAYAADPSLVVMPDGFAESLEKMIRFVLLGVLADGGALTA